MVSRVKHVCTTFERMKHWRGGRGGGWRGLNGGVEARSNINTIILFHSSTGCLKICESRRNNKDFELKYVIFIDVVCNL